MQTHAKNIIALYKEIISKGEYKWKYIPFSIILVFLIFYLILKKDSRKEKYLNIIILSTIIEIFIEQGNFIILGTIEISYAILMKIILTLFSLIMIIKKKKVSKKLILISSIFLAVILIGIINLILNPISAYVGTFDVPWDEVMRGAMLQKVQFNTKNIEQLLQFFMYAISLVGIYVSFDKDDFKRFYFKNRKSY